MATFEEQRSGNNYTYFVKYTSKFGHKHLLNQQHNSLAEFKKYDYDLGIEIIAILILLLIYITIIAFKIFK